MSITVEQKAAVIAEHAREAGDTGPYMRNSVTNRSDFTMLFKRWAKISLDAMAELKAMSPIPENPVAPR